MAFEIDNHIEDHEALGIKSQAQNDSRYLKLDASNDPITDQLDVNNIHTATDFQGYGGVPATMSKGLKSPYTRTVVVDQDGKGDYTTIKEACDWVATQTRSSFLSWNIMVNPGIFQESPFTIPTYTNLIGYTYVSHNSTTTLQSSIYFAATNTSGDLITLAGSGSNINYFYIGTYAITPTGDITLISAGAGQSNIANCWLGITARANVYNVRTIKKTGSAALFVTGSAISATFSSGTDANGIVVENAGTNPVFFSYSNFVPQGTLTGTGLANTSTGSIVLAYCRIGLISGTPYSTNDIVVGSGTAIINNTPIRKVSGTPTFIDTYFSTPAGLRTANTATDIPLSVVGATSQNANLTEWQNSAGTVLSSISPLGHLSIGTTANDNRMLNIDISKAYSGTYFPVYVRSYNTGNSSGSGLAFYAYANATSGTTASLYGILGTAANNNANTVTALIGNQATIGAYSTGATTNAYGFQSNLAASSASATISNYYGYHLNISQSTSTLTNVYGLYLPNLNFGTDHNYAIYTNAGLVRFGDVVNTTENYQVDGVQVVTNQQSHIADADGTLADLTTKFNTLLTYLETHGLVASV
jgi:hypothetical protein